MAWRGFGGAVGSSSRKGGQSDVDRLLDASSPIREFVSEFCDLDPTFEVDKNELYEVYLQFRADEGHTGRPAKNTFTSDLRQAFPKIDTVRRREGEQRVQRYAGIRFNEAGQALRRAGW